MDEKIWRMRIACWIPKATDTRSLYVLVAAFPRQQWLREGALLLRYTCSACYPAIFLVRLQP